MINVLKVFFTTHARVLSVAPSKKEVQKAILGSARIQVEILLCVVAMVVMLTQAEQLAGISV